jgi:hypothetical protein
MAAVRETPERFGGEMKRAMWLLKNRTYVDDAAEGVDNQRK